MSPKRKDRVAPPPIAGEWDVRFSTSEAVKGWDALCQQAPGNTRWAWDLMRTDPCPPPTPRHHRLKGQLATGTHDGRTLPYWQIEVTGSGRIWYLVDEDRKTVWMHVGGPGHPKPTD